MNRTGIFYLSKLLDVFDSKNLLPVVVESCPEEHVLFRQH